MLPHVEASQTSRDADVRSWRSIEKPKLCCTDGSSARVMAAWMDVSGTRRDDAMANSAGPCREFAVFMMEAATQRGSARDL